MTARQKSILFVQTDQLTIDVLQAYGNPVAKTPHLDRIVQDGVVFENGYCNYPLCAPASGASGLLRVSQLHRRQCYMLRHEQFKFVVSVEGPPMLFDLEGDPHDRTNLVGDPLHSELVESLTEQANGFWDTDVLMVDIVKSQQRRLLIRRAHGQGRSSIWDFDAGQDDSRYYRGDGNYNDWAFSHLPVPEA